MAGISWPEGVSNGTNSLISNGTKASSEGSLGADLQHSNGTNFLISNGTNSLISNVLNASSGGVLGDLQHSNGTNFLISNVINASLGGFLGADLQHSSGINSLISNMINASSGGVLGDLQHSNGTNFLVSNGTHFLISNMVNSSSGGFLGSDLQHSHGTNSLISNVLNASSRRSLGALQHSNGTNFPISNGTHFLISNMINSSSGGFLGSDLQHSLLAVTYSLILALGLAGLALSLSLSLSLLSRRAKPLSHSYILLLQLALLDALFLAVLPLHVHSQLLGGTWAFGDAACGASRALFFLHISLSVGFLGCLGADAWLAALHPFASVRLRATHYALLAAALWVLALGGSAPLLLHSPGVKSCFGSSSESWAHPTVLAFVFGAFVPFSVVLLGLPLAAGSVWRSGRRAGRRRALGSISIVLGICALCFLPQLLAQLLQLLLGGSEPFPSLIPPVQRVTEALASCSCCLNPLLYLFRSSSRPWRCPCRLRLRLRAKRVFTICDQNFGDPSWDYRPGQRRGKENPRGWNRLIHSRYTQS